MKNFIIHTFLVLTFMGCSTKSDENLKNKQGDLGDGTFINPVLGGDYPDPSIIRDGDDFYMTPLCF